MLRIESLLSARLFLAPQIVGNRIFFLSNMSGHISLYVMDEGGSVPELLLPPHIALQNPELIGGYSYYVYPKLNKILVMLDQDGDENYQPMLIPLEGGFPEATFGDQFENYRVHCHKVDAERNLAYFAVESREEAMNEAFQGNLETQLLTKLGQSKWSANIDGVNEDHSKVILLEGYSAGDHVLRLWTKDDGEASLLYGVPLEERAEGQEVPINSIYSCHFTPDDRGLIFVTSLFSDTYGMGYLDLSNPDNVKPVEISGTVHTGSGQFENVSHLKDKRYLLTYNIDGATWQYEGSFDEDALHMKLDTVVVGEGELSNGKLDAGYYDKEGNRHVLSFSTATAPTQIYTVDGGNGKSVTVHTRERVLGIPNEWLSPGEDASFTSHDGLHISASLYMPAKTLDFEGPRPLAYYIHGGPQSQERPDFAWFSMPLIQFLTLKGFAVFVPNVRGSTGYGFDYMKKVDRDWGGQDRLDHVHAMTEFLPKDKRIDVSRAGVVGRSYGGYMTLTLALRHPELWSAAVNMFGVYDMLTFMDRLPETWKPYFTIAVGDPEKDRDFLIERSPRTYMDQLTAPMLVIQGKNDPRVVERESRDVVEQLRAKGKEVEYLMFENEGHDVLKFENRVRCYNAITDFFTKYLKP